MNYTPKSYLNPQDDSEPTDLHRIKSNPRKFPWGKVLQLIEFGPYGFLHFEDKSEPLTKDTTIPKTGYHVYIEGKDTNTSAETLDGALIVAISRRNLDANEAHHMAQAAAKILGVTK